MLLVPSLRLLDGSSRHVIQQQLDWYKLQSIGFARVPTRRLLTLPLLLTQAISVPRSQHPAGVPPTRSSTSSRGIICQMPSRQDSLVSSRRSRTSIPLSSTRLAAVQPAWHSGLVVA